ncbi:hypothetical protein LDENG_00045410 [Lucifuga dentata]|nr:hypothetical protein LDENG_00045410 [Lucifuga dentata]
MLGNPGNYATKKRKKPVVKHKKPPEVNGVVKSNPSKRHRDRLNSELDRLTELLPFPAELRSRLDKLSVLRLSVGYLRVKSYFKASMKSSSAPPGEIELNGNAADAAGFSEGDLLLQALNGFAIVISTDGLVFYVSATIKDYLGFHQSDVIHQSVLELIHTDDRLMFRQQLHFALKPLPADTLQSCSDTIQYKSEQLPPENSSFLERSFVCRFRCLLDNSSGFLALKFQGRLKYLHSQSVLSDSGTRLQPQLALFAIAVPVQPPSILQIRAKMLMFQTRHKLDFTPTGIDHRGKIILGYSEMELCMKGSGYQFIHAADMMHCADKHICMIKTGESGMTVFRLLSKSGSWVWVQANAKLIYKDKRPDFIIAMQKVLINAEGEDHLRKRSLQFPFNFATGEAVLYDVGPTVDFSQFQFGEMFNSSKKVKEDVNPSSLLDCFLTQDQSVYTQTVDTPLPVDQMFMESHALVNVPSDPWQAAESTALSGEPVLVKEEAKQSVMAVINSLETMAQNGDLFGMLQNLDLDLAESMEWENTLKRSRQEADQEDSFQSDLDSILTNDIFAYMDAALFKENETGSLNANMSSCLSAGNQNQAESFCPATGLPEPQRFQSATSVLHAEQQETGSSLVGTSQIFTEPLHTFSSTQKLCHYGPLLPAPESSTPQLQLQDIFSMSIELPELVLPDASADDASAPFEPCGPASVSRMAASAQSSQILCPQSDMQLLQSSVHMPNATMDALLSLVPSNKFDLSSTCRFPAAFSSACLQDGTQTLQVQQWNQQQMLQPANPASNSQNFSHAGLPPRVNGLNLKHVQQEGVTGGLQALPTSCIFNQHFPSGPAEGVSLSRCCQRGNEAPLDTSPLQASCYFQWSCSEPVVGTTIISQDAVSISPQTDTVHANMADSQHNGSMQHYMECRQTRAQEETSGNDRLPAESKGFLPFPALGR